MCDQVTSNPETRHQKKVKGVMKIFALISALLFSSLILSSCNKDNPIPPDEQPQINLTLEDTSCTEAWLKLTTTNISLPAELTLKQDDSKVQTFNLSSVDTILYVDSLLPNHSYSFQSTIQSISQSSNQLNVSTMDTTSHNFTWQTFTFGGTAGTSTLYDVAIIDENNIWAVGAIYVADTSQNGYTLYNAVHWDGVEWKLNRIKTNACGGVVYPPIQAIFAFSADDILFAHIDGSITHYDGIAFRNDCSLITQLNGSANKIWGTSRYDYYAVSGNGFIAHYQNGQWSKIESGTDLNIGDIWGIQDDTGIYIKYVAADNSMLKIDNNDVLTTINGLSGEIIISIWGKSDRLIYTAGDGVVLYKNNAWEKIDKPEVNSIYRIKGEEFNEIYGISSPGNIIKYFNGYSWYTINTETENRYWRIDSKANRVVASGYNGEAAIVTIITKN